ncbi:MAG TPA: hypothetical protein VHQ00_04215, partial [Chloroflexota bacterium]|nr:hypothetical protein [Chloroflexota bacterium]
GRAAAEAADEGALGIVRGGDPTRARAVRSDVLGQALPEGRFLEAARAAPERPGVAYPVRAYAAESVAGGVQVVYDAARTAGRDPLPEELATAFAAPGSADTAVFRGTPTPIARLLEWAQRGADAKDWYTEYAREVERLATVDGELDPNMLAELLVALGRTGQRTQPHINLRSALKFIETRQVLQDSGRWDDFLRDASAPKGSEAFQRAHELVYQTYTRLGGPGMLAMRQVLPDMMKLWTTGQIEIGGNMKLANYTGAFRDSLHNLPDMLGVPDSWMFNAFGFADPDAASKNPNASQYIVASLAELASRLGVSPIELQAMIWTGYRRAVGAGEAPAGRASAAAGALEGDLGAVVARIQPWVDDFRQKVQSGAIRPTQFAGAEPEVAYRGPRFEATLAARERAREALGAQARQVRVAGLAQPGLGIGIDLPAPEAEAFNLEWVGHDLGYEGGQLRLLRDLGIPHDAAPGRVGVWTDDAGQTATQWDMTIRLPTATPELQARVSAVYGKIGHQDAVGNYRPRFVDDPAADNMVLLPHPEGKPWTRDEMARLGIPEAAPGAEIAHDPTFLLWNDYAAEGPPFLGKIEAQLVRAGFDPDQVYSASGEF